MDMRDEETAQRFAEEVELFAAWVGSDVTPGEADARAVLVRLASLYAAALLLPPVGADLATTEPVQRVDDREWAMVFERARRLPLDLYGAQLDPLVVPAGEAGVGSLADDVADIYRDVVTGLREHRAGRHRAALFEWSFGFRSHWGSHATGAIRALHAWVITHAGTKRW